MGRTYGKCSLLACITPHSLCSDVKKEPSCFICVLDPSVIAPIPAGRPRLLLCGVSGSFGFIHHFLLKIVSAREIHSSVQTWSCRLPSLPPPHAAVGGGGRSLQPCPPSYAAEGQWVWSPSGGWPGLLNPYCGVVPVHHPPGAVQVLWAFLCAWRSNLPLLPSLLRGRGLTSLTAAPAPTPSLLTSSEGSWSSASSLALRFPISGAFQG